MKENTYYDVPVSVFLTDIEKETIDLIIKIIGVKTKEFQKTKTGDTVFLRGPYHNGILGIKALTKLHGSRAAVICKGIGFMPSLGAINLLHMNHTEILSNQFKENTNEVRMLLDEWINELKAPSGSPEGGVNVEK